MAEQTSGTGQFVDPVCGMSVTDASGHHHVHDGVDYYFCCAGCQQKFAQHPEQYLNPSPSNKEEVHENSSLYTCPMHPEVEQICPGSCPKCGMALEAKTITVEEDNTELVEMTNRLWISAALALPVFVLAMLADMAPALLPEALSMQVVQWLQFILATPVVLWGGWPFFVRAVGDQLEPEYVHPDQSGRCRRLELQQYRVVLSPSFSRRHANAGRTGRRIF